jgi:hypothetical protein
MKEEEKMRGRREMKLQFMCGFDGWERLDCVSWIVTPCRWY